MNKEIKTKHVEYLSLFLVLSFLVIQNIYLVFTGISLSIYVLNKKLFNNLINKFIHSQKNRIGNEYKIGKNIHINAESTNQDSKIEERIVSLVDVIEESGFIPSLAKKENSNVS